MSPSARAVSCDIPEVESAADELLRRGNAVDAVVAGVAAACALLPSVFLGPLTIVCGGAGAGEHAFDGRLRQPGRGAPRPRGFVSAGDVPPAARVAVPWLVPALFGALSTVGSATPSRAFGPAMALAKGTARRDVLDAVLARGGRALSERAIGEGLLAAGGRLAGGLLTREDLEAAAGLSAPLEHERVGELSVGRPPWRDAARADGGRVHVIAAIDRNGMGALACFETVDGEGISLEELQLVAPLRAVPVRRGAERLRPGTPLAASTPLAVVARSGMLEAVVGMAQAGDADLDAVLGAYARTGQIAPPARGTLVAAARAGKGAARFRMHTATSVES